MKDKIRLFWHVTRIALVTAGCLVMPLTAAPVQAASQPNQPLPGVTIVGNLSDAKAAYAALPAPTAAQLAAAQAWLAAHPAMQGTIVKLKQPGGGSGTTSKYVSVNWYWWGIRLHLTQADVHNIWDLIWAAGIGAAAAILCAPGGWLAVACAIIGAVVAYIVAELIWNVIGYWVPGCGVHIDFYWWGGYGWGAC